MGLRILTLIVVVTNNFGQPTGGTSRPPAIPAVASALSIVAAFRFYLLGFLLVTRGSFSPPFVLISAK